MNESEWYPEKRDRKKKVEAKGWHELVAFLCQSYFMSSQVQVQFSLLQESPTFLRKLTFFITLFVSRLGRYFLLKKIY